MTAKRKKLKSPSPFTIWDYLPPSMALTDSYVKEHNLENWQAEIALMIGEHHKITPFHSSQYPLVEVLRKADLVDFLLGLVRHGVDKGSD